MNNDDDTDLLDDDELELDEQKTLELSTKQPKKAQPKGIKIDGVFYEYIDPNEWSLSERNAFTHQYERIRKLEAVKNPSDRHERAYNEATIKLLQMAVLELPEETIMHLNIGARTTLMMDFFLKAAKQSHFFESMTAFFGTNFAST